MREVFPGVFHWTAIHPNLHAPVSSYYVEPAGVLIDPMVPDGGWEAFAERTRPQQVLLTSGNHTRDAARFAEEYGCPIVTSREGAERIGDGLATELYSESHDVAPGVRAIHIGILSPDEYALHVDVGEGAIAVADGVTRYGDVLGFFPDHLLGDDPQRIKAGLKQQLATLLDRRFEHLLFAHGDPIVGGGRTALADFVNSPVGQEDFGASI
ncbi:MAG: hypothetical protein AVDCRST_MAG38-960 [uncultured Solirubrobacteraceae bacterium]|uniref:Metallo-beta-lactamase domain-containing protein n=1 Tax=uncultured Solirubrobacteraceae bacterium TaxID=1162706 RepID=A0A6J4R8B8_9ACTN|nr:MAG: hypothetical protein AVDCRST_MAG38-960 [uncultured Solirubrobacteraceae bacterium]